MPSSTYSSSQKRLSNNKVPNPTTTATNSPKRPTASLSSTTTASSSTSSRKRRSASSAGSEPAGETQTTNNVDASANGDASAQHELPFTKIRSIMMSTPDTMRANEEGLYAMTKAAEAFIALLAKGAYECSKGKIILYSNLAEYVQEHENLSHIHEMVPRKVRFSTVEKAVLATQRRNS